MEEGTLWVKPASILPGDLILGIHEFEGSDGKPAFVFRIKRANKEDDA